MIECVVQNEVGNCSIEHKRLVAQLIINRVESGIFPDTVYEVLHQDGQFTAIDNYYKKRIEVTEETKQAVYEVVNDICKDNTNGALYYYNPKFTSKKIGRWFERDLEYLFSYTDELYGVKYTHKFFK